MLKKERISESELLTRLLEGERQAFDEIFTRYYTSPCAFANLYVKQTEVAENIVQDLMLWLWELRHPRGRGAAAAFGGAGRHRPAPDAAPGCQISPRPAFLMRPSAVSDSTILSSTPLMKTLLPGVE